MRLFVGIKASRKIDSKVLKWQKENKDLPLRFIKPENLHITLIPPFYKKSPKTSIKKLRTIKFRPFSIVFSKLYINKINRVIWIESSNPPREIFKIQKNLSKLFKSKEKREFKIHLTIARFKDSKSLKNLRFTKINWEEKVDNITLFESKLGRKEANYKELFKIHV